MKIMITAPKGKMGRLILKAAAENDKLDIVGALGPAGRDYIGQDAGRAAGFGFDAGVPVSDALEELIARCDAVIDFSTVELSMAVLDAALRHKKALVCGTTGFSEEQLAAISEASASIPLLHASNTSYVVSLMYRLLALAAGNLAGRADIDIIDMHDRQKKDAPSGTAKEMASVIAEALGGDSAGDAIRFHSIRSGNISSSHSVIFGCMGERLEITHHAYDWECFAKGACDAALFLDGRGPGLYSMQDVVRV